MSVNRFHTILLFANYFHLAGTNGEKSPPWLFPLAFYGVIEKNDEKIGVMLMPLMEMRIFVNPLLYV